MIKTIFDIGANKGETFLDAARQGHNVFAFEPTPELADFIRSWLAKENLSNYKFYELAISDIEGIQKLNISGLWGWGCTSLHEFTDNIHSLWPGREDFRVTHTAEVEVIRLDTFIKQNKIEEIDYLHVDTQGNDYNVLVSLGDQYHIVKEGVIEVPNRVKLYKTKYSKEDYLRLLEKMNFEITKIENDGGDRGSDYEQNVFFKRK